MCASVLTILNESSMYIKAKKDATSELFTIKEASDWASKYLNKKVTTSNRKIDNIKAWRMLINKGC